MIVAWKLTTTTPPAAMVPMGTPAMGDAPGCATPPMVKLLGTNVIPAGGVSKKTTLSALAVPAVLSRRIVYGDGIADDRGRLVHGLGFADEARRADVDLAVRAP